MRSHTPLQGLYPLLIAALLLVGCVPGATTLPPTTDPSVPTPSPTRTPTATASQVPPIQVDDAALRGLRIQVWHAFTGEAYQVFSDQVELFNAVNEWGLEVSEQGYGDYTTLLEAVESANLSGSLPGLVAAQPEQILAWDGLGRVLDLKRYATDPYWGLEEQALEDIPPVFRSQDLYRGRQLGLPALRSAVFLFYNQSWGRELGFDQPPGTRRNSASRSARPMPISARMPACRMTGWAAGSSTPAGRPPTPGCWPLAAGSRTGASTASAARRTWPRWPS